MSISPIGEPDVDRGGQPRMRSASSKCPRNHPTRLAPHPLNSHHDPRPLTLRSAARSRAPSWPLVALFHPRHSGQVALLWLHCSRPPRFQPPPWEPGFLRWSLEPVVSAGRPSCRSPLDPAAEARTAAAMITTWRAARAGWAARVAGAAAGAAQGAHRRWRRRWWRRSGGADGLQLLSP